MGVVTGIVGLAGGLGGFLLPIIFGILLDFFSVRSTCFIFLYGIVWVSLILVYLSEVRRTPVAGSVAWPRSQTRSAEIRAGCRLCLPACFLLMEVPDETP
ncbi:nitrate/nitrite transporter NarK [Paraburkholderia atlantica]